ncbi:ABC transporter ATP-binding protein [Micromonospora maris]|uniref:ABC transporter ATP-binding protein n=1 Tax=Micromonospora maris TaxID=1003110 RepID=A0A9X0I5C7_9ACTN|nr:ABC transporter ATP-binding protein [Micromonospora maris]AEB45332.1 ABC transporter related protein [Micromonospora maris AB-18-032]KUJ47092.1 ABC transporter ATP-binding protein [Micromonospora maris]
MGASFAAELHEVSKRYPGGVTAVDGLSLRVREGEVLGFLGPNGAGKTTTMRMLVGLVRPSAGRIQVLGQPPGRQLARIGALIESPTFYPHLSGRDNLRLAARYAGVPDAAADRVLDEVGLTARASSPFRTYSLGMKQRLGVAAALLKEPALLILDEPTNGLDPAGVAEMRELLRSLGQGGRTVLLSSHVLGEVEQVCDRIAVIDRGRLIAEGTPDELRDALGTGVLLIDADPADEAIACLGADDRVRAVEQVDGTLRVSTDPALAGALNRRLVTAGVDVRELRPLRHSLEEAFLELTTPTASAHRRSDQPEATTGAQR